MATEKRERKRQNQAVRRAALEAARKKAERQARLKRLLVAGAVLVVGVLGLTYILTRGDDHTDVASEDSTTTTTEKPQVPVVPAGRRITGDTPCPKADGTEERASSFEKAPPTCIDPAKTYTATFDTTVGTIVVDLDTKATPQTANNFVVLSRYKYYDGSSFQRTDPDIDIIQGGSPSTQTISDPGPGYTIKDEPAFTADPASGGLKGPYTYTEGDIVMARSAGADSAGAQYFFSAGPKTSNLNAQGTYVRFGRVSSGLDLLKQVLATSEPCPETAASCLGGRPSPPVTVRSITITEK